MKNEFEIKHTGDVKTLLIREGAALPLKEPTPVSITGVITTIFMWLEKRVEEIDQLKSYILVEKDKLQMTLIVEENDFYKTTIISQLKLSEEYKAFGINSDKEWECWELAKFIKMNRSFFQDKVVANNVREELQNFKAKINTEKDKIKDDRANMEVRVKQAVESNLPEDLKIKIPVFKGLKPINLTLEIFIEPTTLACSFICPEAADFIHEETEAIFNEQIDKIKAIAPKLAILNA